jgi:starch phosphorylase
LSRFATASSPPTSPIASIHLVNSLLQRDDYLLFADYAAYVVCQDRVSAAYQDTQSWTRMSILNVARMGYFSSDRSIREYCEEIWKVKPVTI